LVLGRSVAVGGVYLKDCRDCPGEGVSSGFEKTQRRGKGVEAGVDGELVVVVGIIAIGIGGKAASRPVLETLIDREDDQLAGVAQTPMGQDAGEVGLGAGVITFIIAQDPVNAPVDPHFLSPQISV